MQSGKTEGTAVFLSNRLFPNLTVTVKKMITALTASSVAVVILIST